MPLNQITHVDQGRIEDNLECHLHVFCFVATVLNYIYSGKIIWFEARCKKITGCRKSERTARKILNFNFNFNFNRQKNALLTLHLFIATCDRALRIKKWQAIKRLGESKTSEEMNKRKKNDFPGFQTLSTCFLRFRYCKSSK